MLLRTPLIRVRKGNTLLLNSTYLRGLRIVPREGPTQTLNLKAMASGHR